MSKREKILIGLTILTVFYGIYVWFLASPQQSAIAVDDKKNQKELNAFILKVAEKTAVRLSKNQVYALQKAQAQWQQVMATYTVTTTAATGPGSLADASDEYSEKRLEDEWDGAVTLTSK